MKFNIKVLLVSVTLAGMIAALAPHVADAAPGARSGGGGVRHSGPASSGSVRGSHSNNRRDRMDNRHDTRRDVRDDRRDFREDRVRRHRARHITYAVFRNLNCRTTIIVDAGISYYSCGGTYYERVYQGGSVVYVIVTAPPGY